MHATLTEPGTMLLNVEAACKALSVCEATLRKLPIPFVKVRNARRYDVDDLRAYIAANKQTA